MEGFFRLDSSWLIPAISATFLGSLILTIASLYLYYYNREQFLLFWVSSWFVNSCRYLLSLILVFHELDIVLIGNQICAMVAGLLLVIGSAKMVHKSIPKVFYYILGALVPWTILSIILELSFMLVTFPTFTYLAIIYIWTGFALYSYREIDLLNRTFLGIIFLLWGLHKADYPFLRTVEWFAPIGFLFSAICEISVALALIFVFFQILKKDLMGLLVEIEDNLKKYNYTLDQIKNPLFVIAGYAELEDNEKIIEQVNSINETLKYLEDSWISSERALKRIKRTYRDI